MLSLRGMDMNQIALALDISVSTVYRWRKGDTSPTARQVYTICSVLRLRPTTFAPYTGHSVVHHMPDNKDGVAPAAMGEWVRRRIREARQKSQAAGTSLDLTYLTERCGLNRRTVRKCTISDDVRWDNLLWFLENGLRVLPHNLLNPNLSTPIPHIEGSFADYTQAFAENAEEGARKKPRRSATNE